MRNYEQNKPQTQHRHSYVRISRGEALAKIKHLATKQNISLEDIEHSYISFIAGFSSTCSFRSHDRLHRFLEQALNQAPMVA